MNSKKQYTAPELTVISFKVEQGFTNSSVSSTFNFFQDLSQNSANQSYNSQCQQNWSNGNGDGGSYFGSGW